MNRHRVISSNTFGPNARIHQGDIIHNYRMIPQVCNTIPFPRNEDMINRHDLFTELDRLLPPGPNYYSAALWGLGGSGKTQIALEFAYCRSRDPNCSVFWVHAENETAFMQDYRLITQKLGVMNELDGEDLMAMVCRCIEANPNWVLILDNADNLSLFGLSRCSSGVTAQNATLSRFIPRSPTGSVLWTSRDEWIAGTLVGAGRAIQVSQMSLHEATKLLETTTGEKIDAEKTAAAGSLLAELQYLPLAVSQAGTYMKKTSMSIRGYLSKMEDSKGRWKILRQSQPDRHRRNIVSNSVLDTWTVCIEYIRNNHQVAFQILQIIAFVDNQDIPLEIIRWVAFYERDNYTRGLRNDFEVMDSCGSESGADDDELNDAISRLCEFSFLSLRISQDGNRAYEVHKLVHEATRYGLGRQNFPGEEARFASAALQIVYALFPDTSLQYWDECETYLSHAMRVTQWAEICKEEATAADILVQVSGYLTSRGRIREDVVVCTRAYKLRQKALGEEHGDTLLAKARLTNTYSDKGEYAECKRLLELMSAQFDKVFGREHEYTLRHMDSLADTNYRLGNFDEAQRLQSKTLELRRKVLGSAHPDTVSSILGISLLCHARGKYHEAEETAQEALALQRLAFGDTNHKTLLPMDILVDVYQSLGKFKKMEEIAEKSLKIRQNLLGATHPYSIFSMGSLGSAYQALGHYNKAEAMFKDAIQSYNNELGEKHPVTLMAMADLQFLYYDRQQYKEAEELATKILPIRLEVLGSSHPDTIESMATLGAVHFALQRHDEAKDILLQVISWRREHYGAEHPETLDCMCQLAAVYHALENYGDAEGYAAETLERQSNTLGEGNPSTLDTMTLLAAIHVSLTRYDEAEVLLQKVLAFQHENHGRLHRDMLDIMSNLAHVLEELEKYDEAEEMLTRLIELQREVLGNNHRDTRRTNTARKDLRIFVRDSEEFLI